MLNILKPNLLVRVIKFECYLC